MEIRITDYQTADYSGVIKLLGESFSSTIEQNALELHDLDDNHSIIVAKSEAGDTCGCAVLEKKIDYIRNNPVLFVLYLAVDQQYRRHGIGKQMISHIEQYAKEMNYNAIELTSADFRTEAHTFYNSMGFTRKKTTVFIKEVR